MASERRVPLAYIIFFSLLYALQGVTVAYIFNFNKAYMKAAGVREDVAASVETIALLPFVFKFLAGPVSDRFSLFGMGHRRPYIVVGLLIQMAGLAGLALVNPGRDLAWFGAMAFLTVFGLALYDTCCDGMVVDVTPAEDRSRVQGMLWTSRFLATTVCTFAFGFLLQKTGVGPGKGEPVLWLCAAGGLIPLVFGLWLREPSRAKVVEVFDWSALKVLIKPRSLVLLAFGALYAMVGVGAEFNLSPFYGRLGFGSEKVGTFGAIRYFGRALGAIALPIAWRRMKRSSILLLGVVALAASTALQAVNAGTFMTGCSALFFGIANGWNDALFSVLAMECSDPRMAASTFALLNAVTNLSVVGNYLFARGVVAARGDDRVVYLVASAFTAFLVIFVPALAKKPKDEPEPSAAIAQGG